MPATDDTRRPFEQHRYEDTVERVLALPERDLLMVFRELTERLGQDAEVPLPVEERVDHRSAALAALQRVAEYLQLDRVARQRLTYQRYSQTAAELGLEWNAARIGRAFGGWDNAKLALLGQPLPRQRQRQLRNRRAERQVHCSEETLTGLRLWLASGPSRRTISSYDRFRQEWNENVGPAGRPLVSAQTARNNLRLRHWGDVVRLAGGAEFEQLEKRRSQPMRAAPPQEVTPIAGQGWELVDRFERGRRIHYLRTSLNWTMEQLGDRAGVNRASISNMESGKREGGLEMLLGVARAFNVSLDLLGRASRDHFELAVRPIFDPVAGPAALALGTLGPAEIGRRVRSVRHLHGWTQGVLASRAGLASSGTGFQDRGGPGHRDQQQRRQTGSGAGPPVRRARRSEVGRLSGCGAGSGERRDGLTY